MIEILKLIELKKNKKELSKNQINYIIDNFTKGLIPDYQMSSFLMAICCNSMNINEIIHLTDAMVNSGKIYDLSDINILKFDKHSSGGIGDKVTLIFAPLIASFGFKVAKISGKGLGITGGTIDKLESFKGFNSKLSFNDFKENIKKVNISIISQSDNIVPADKKIYELRNNSCTIDSIPLIASSIMSKKIAIDNDVIFLDVKCGNGSFIKKIKEAKKLAKIMVNIGKYYNKKVISEITNMNQPIGRTIGNAIEIYEVIKTLNGNGPEDLVNIACEAAARSLYYSKISNNFKKIFYECKNRLKSGKLVNYFIDFIKQQGGDLSLLNNIDNLDTMLNNQKKIEIKSEFSGYFKIIDVEKLGLLSIYLGAGRFNYNDKIDHMSGIFLNKISGEWVNKNETVMTLYTKKNINSNIYNKIIKKIFIIINNNFFKIKNKKVIYKIIK